MSVIPPEVVAIVEKARAMQAEQERCERLTGHWYTGTTHSRILFPQLEFDPSYVTREVFAGRLSPDAYFTSSWVCGSCGLRVSKEEAERHRRSGWYELRKYYGSRLWC